MTDWFHSIYCDEQDSEIEALSGIFMDDFTELEPSSDGPRCFKLHLIPSLGDDEKPFISIDLYITYIKTYPRDLPKYEIKNIKGLEDEHINELKNIIDTQLTNLQGDPLIFELSMIIRDKLSEFNEAPLSLYDQREERNKALMNNDLSINNNIIVNDNNNNNNNDNKNRINIIIDSVAYPIQGSPNSTRKSRSKSQITFRWNKEKLYCEGRYGNLYYGSNLSHPDSPLIIKEIHLPIPLLCPSGYNLKNIKLYKITQKINSLVSLSHNNIAKYYGIESFNTNNDFGYIQILREYIEGTSLSDYIKRNGGIRDEIELGQIIISILSALEYLYIHNITHQHLNLNNIILSTEGLYYLTDFGIEKTFLDAHKTHEDNPILFTKKHDIWNIGALLIDLITGGKDDYYDLFDISKVIIPTNISINLSLFIKQCFNFNNNDNINELFNCEFIKIINKSNNLLDDSGLLYSCEMPKDSTSRYVSDFEEIAFIGRGGFGEVVKARNRLDGRVYAIKKIPLDSDNMEENKNILREVTTLARLHHEYVVRYYQAWIETNTINTNLQTDSLCSFEQPFTNDGFDISDESSSELEFCNPDDDYSSDDNDFIKYNSKLDKFNNNTNTNTNSLEDSNSGSFGGFESDESLGLEGSTILYIQMEYCTGETLGNLITDKVLINNTEKIRRLFRQLIEGLDHIHQQNMIHRDLKPANIFLDSKRNVKIGDFGLATANSVDTNILTNISHSKDNNNNDNKDDTVVGTVFYSAPEQRLKHSTCTPKADIFSLGIILLEMCYPFSTRMERASILGEAWNNHKLPLSFLESHPDESEIILWLLSSNPEDRPTTTELLQCGLIPQQIGDAKLLDSLNSITVPGTTIYTQLMKQLFSIPPDSYLDYSYNSYSLLPSYTDTLLHNTIKDSIKKKFIKLFQQRGYRRIDAPLLVPKSTLNVSSNTVYILNESGTVLMLPYDLTLPFANYVASSRINSVKRYTFGAVYRKNELGRQPHCIQEMDFDIISSPNAGALREAELFYDLRPILLHLNKKTGGRYHIYINHAEIYKQILLYCGVLNENIIQVCEILEKRLKKPWSVIQRRLLKQKLVSCDCIKRLESLTDIQCELKILSKVLPNEIKDNPIIIEAQKYIKKFEQYLASFCVLDNSCIKFHSGISHNISYRDGLMFVITMEYINKEKEIFGAGGSYSKLIGKYLPPESSIIPSAIGVSFSMNRIISRIIKYYKEQQDIDNIKHKYSEIDVLLYADYDDSLHDRMRMVSNLWNSNIKADYIYPEKSTIDNISIYCKSLNISYLIIMKKYSLAQGKITLRDITNHHQKEETIYIDNIIKVLTEKKENQINSNTLLLHHHSSLSKNINDNKSPSITPIKHSSNKLSNQFAVWLCTSISLQSNNNSNNNAKSSRKLIQDIERVLQPVINYIKKNTIHIIATDLPIDVIHNICSNAKINIRKYKTQLESIKSIITSLDKEPNIIFLYSHITGSLDVMQRSTFKYL